MILRGIAATPHSALQGHVLLAGAVDVAQRIPLWIEHSHEIGEILHLQYIGDALHIMAETDDADAAQLGFFSVSGKPVERTRDGGLWRVTKFSLLEVSLVRRPVNANCRVYERSAHDPLRELAKIRSHQLDLVIRGFGVLAQGLQLMARPA